MCLLRNNPWPLSIQSSTLLKNIRQLSLADPAAIIEFYDAQNIFKYFE